MTDRGQCCFSCFTARWNKTSRVFNFQLDINKVLWIKIFLRKTVVYVCFQLGNLPNSFSVTLQTCTSVESLLCIDNLFLKIQAKSGQTTSFSHESNSFFVKRWNILVFQSKEFMCPENSDLFKSHLGLFTGRIYKKNKYILFFRAVPSPASSPLWHEHRYSSSLIKFISVLVFKISGSSPPFSEPWFRNNDMKWWLPAEAITSLASFGNKPTVCRVIYQKKKKKKPHIITDEKTRFLPSMLFPVSRSWTRCLFWAETSLH